MQRPIKPDNEQERLHGLYHLNILDTEPEERFDKITRLARMVFDLPIALVSIVDKDRQWFKSSCGLSARETPRDISFCGHAILGQDIFVIPDTFLDDRFHDNPLVTGQPFIRFYAGMPLFSNNGLAIGTLCVVDIKPRTFSEKELERFKDIAVLAEKELLANSSS